LGEAKTALFGIVVRLTVKIPQPPNKLNIGVNTIVLGNLTKGYKVKCHNFYFYFLPCHRPFG
jgi:hypothetical protein